MGNMLTGLFDGKFSGFFYVVLSIMIIFKSFLVWGKVSQSKYSIGDESKSFPWQIIEYGHMMRSCVP